MSAIYTALPLCITVVAVFTVMYFNNETAKKVYVWVSFIAIGALIALRNITVGADTANYYWMYNQLGLLSESDLEVGYVWLTMFLNMFSKNPRTLFVFQGFLVAISYALFVIDNTEEVREAYLATLAFLAFNLFSFHLTGVRQSIAMCICLFAYKMIKHNRLLPFLLIALFASLFHTSALLFVPAYWVAHAEGRKAAIISTLGTVFGIFFLERTMGVFSLFSNRFSDYGIEATDNGYIFVAVIGLITVFDVCFHIAITKKTKLHAAHSKLNYCNLGMWVMRLFTRVIERVSFFYMPSTVIVICHTHGCVKTTKDRKIYINMIAILLIALYLYRMRGQVYLFC